MPGKVNPVIPEVVLQVAAQVIGNDTAITVAGTQGNFELNVRVPMIARNLFESIRILTSRLPGCWPSSCVDGIEANEEALQRHAESTPAIATALNPHIGYDRGTEIVQGGGAPRGARSARWRSRRAWTRQTLDEALDLRAMARGIEEPRRQLSSRSRGPGRCRPGPSGSRRSRARVGAGSSQRAFTVAPRRPARPCRPAGRAPG